MCNDEPSRRYSCLLSIGILGLAMQGDCRPFGATPRRRDSYRDLLRTSRAVLAFFRKSATTCAAPCRQRHMVSSCVLIESVYNCCKFSESQPLISSKSGFPSSVANADKTRCEGFSSIRYYNLFCLNCVSLCATCIRHHLFTQNFTSILKILFVRCRNFWIINASIQIRNLFR